MRSANQISEAPWFPSAAGTSELKFWVIIFKLINKLRLVQGWRGEEGEEMKRRGRGYVVKDCLESVSWQIFKSVIPLT